METASYPDVLRRTGTTGTVTVQLVIDTLGRAEPGSLVLQSSHPGFEAAARAYVLGALFRPGRMRGRAVRVLVRLPISFTLRPPRWPWSPPHLAVIVFQWGLQHPPAANW